MEKPKILIIVQDDETEKIIWEQISHDWEDAKARLENAKNFYENLPEEELENSNEYNLSDDIFNQKVEA
jgi:hypothetical protein